MLSIPNRGKVDLVPLRDDPQQRRAFARRVRQPLELPGGELAAIWCARREDVIIGKLAAWTEGRSRKHESDILQMLIGRRNAQPAQGSFVISEQAMKPWIASFQEPALDELARRE